MTDHREGCCNKEESAIDAPKGAKSEAIWQTSGIFLRLTYVKQINGYVHPVNAFLEALRDYILAQRSHRTEEFFGGTCQSGMNPRVRASQGWRAMGNCSQAGAVCRKTPRIAAYSFAH